MRPPLWALLIAGLIEGCTPVEGLSAIETLKAPFDVEARRALMGRPPAHFACPAPPAPMRDVDANTFYSDSNHSIVDAERYRRNQEITRPLAEFTRKLGDFGDAWMGSLPANPAPARCALDWLDTWAGAEALLGTLTMQGAYERKWTLAGSALAYLRVRYAPGLDPARKARVEAWFVRLARAMIPYYERPPGSGISDKINNHLYWAALAAASAGVAAGDRTLFDWGIQRYRFAARQIAADGTLPLELARRSKAHAYHVFSAMPLVMLAELGRANGLDLYAEEGGALGRLVHRAVDGFADPSYLARAAGAPQEIEKIDAWRTSWMEIWYARTGDPAVLLWLASNRPARNRWLGGDATLAFGVRDLPQP